MQTTLYNSFINRYLRGDVESAFPCTAYVLNSKYAELDNTKYYLRNISDFNSLSANSLVYDAGVLAGTFLASGYEISNTYYRDLSLDEETQAEPVIITNDNLSAFSGMLAVNGELPDKYRQYLDKYYYFYLVRRNDEFISLAKRVKDLERYAVVLSDDIDNVVVNGSVFGNSESHPFRGVFDGNGYTVAISVINANKTSNGLFGYIAEEGIVKNTVITHSNQTQKLSVNSTNEISLTTIKQGKGDFKYGILVGTNYGTIENVFLNADIEYDGSFRPSVYFIQNKSDYESFLSYAWKSVVSQYGDEYNILQRSPELTDFTNICFPTQLCLNSKANIVPYVGYFNEGVFADTYGVINDNDMYNSDAPIELSDTSRDIDSYSQTYNADIYKLYLDKHPVVNKSGEGTRYYEGNYTMRPWGNTSEEDYTDTTKGAFRLGPNDKAAYLIGNLVGFNGGTLKNIVSESTATFNTNTVALIGGIAGRDSGGKLNNVKVCTTFKGSTELFDECITVQDTNLLVAHASASYLLSDVLSAATLTIPYKGDAGVSTTTTVSVTSLSNTIGAVSNIYDISLEDTLGRTYSQDDVYNDVVKNGDLYRLSYSGSNVTDTNVAVADGTITVTDVSISNTILEVTGSDTSANTGKIVTTQNVFSSISAVDVDQDSVEYTDPCVSSNIYASRPIVQISYDVVYYTDSQHTDTATASLTTTAELNANYDVSVTAQHTQSNNSHLPELVRQRYTVQNDTRQSLDADSKNLRLFPILNIGGMFGEYVYSDGQDVQNCRSEIYADNFNNVSGVSGASVKEFNVISLFASNLTFDSSLKSNPDFYIDNFVASANTKLTNTLHCTVQTTDSNAIQQQYLRNCSDIVASGAKVSYAHYINCYNQIAPALVTTNGALIEHKKNTSRIPDIGLQYNDQLFFEVGLNMGPGYEVKDFDMDDFLKYSIEKTSSYTDGTTTALLSGRYFNYPAQVSSCYIKDAEQLTDYANNHTKSYDAWFYDKIFNTVYDTGDTTANSTAYVSKQLLVNPSHYPLYRSRASMFFDTVTSSYRSSVDLNDYEQVVIRVPVEVGTYTKQEFGEASNIIVDAKQELCSNLSGMHVDDSVPNYTYAYSSENADYKALKQIPVLVKYNPNFYTLSDTQQDRTTVIQLGATIDDAIASAEYLLDTTNNDIGHHSPSIKNYTIESSSYKGSVAYGASQRVYDINAAQDGVLQLDTIDINEFEHSNSVLDIKLSVPSNYDIIYDSYSKFVEMQLCDYSGVHYRAQQYYSMRGDADTNCIKIEVPHAFDDEHTYGKFEPVRTSVGEVVYTFTANEYGANNTVIQHPMSAVMRFNVNLKQETVLKESADDDYVVLSANSLVYGFIPTSGDIIDILNSDVTRTFTCTGLSADDMRYILLVDDAQRPILDISLDATACDNAGYIVKFEPRLSDFTIDKFAYESDTYNGTFTYRDDASCGRLINIENGNN